MTLFGAALLLAGGYFFAFPEKVPGLIKQIPGNNWIFLGMGLVGLGLFIGGLA